MNDVSLHNQEQHHNEIGYDKSPNPHQHDELRPEAKHDEAIESGDVTEERISSSDTLQQLHLELKELEQQYGMFKNQFVASINQIAENITHTWDEKFRAHVANIQSSIQHSNEYLATLEERQKEKEQLHLWITRMMQRLNDPQMMEG